MLLKLIKFNAKKYSMTFIIILSINIVAFSLQLVGSRRYLDLFLFFIGVADSIFIIYSILEMYKTIFYEGDMQEHIIPTNLKTRIFAKFIYFSFAYLIISIFYNYTRIWGKENSVVHFIKEPIKFYLLQLVSEFGGFIASLTLIIFTILLALKIVTFFKRRDPMILAAIIFIVLFWAIAITFQTLGAVVPKQVLEIPFDIKAHFNDVDYYYSTAYLFLKGSTVMGSTFSRMTSREIMIGIETLYINYITLIITSILSWLILLMKKYKDER